MKKFFKRLAATILLLVIAAVVYVGFAYVKPGYEQYKQAIELCPIETKVASIKAQENYTTIDSVPQIYLDAVIAVEDHDFKSHGAFNIKSILRAVFVNIKEKELIEGGSTITQQVAKNLYFEQDKTLTRKFAELFLAIRLEEIYEKDEILEIYINSIYFGGGYYCIYDAAMGYYGVEPAYLNDFQATVLAGVPNAPSVYSPHNQTELTYQRQRQVLDSMVEYGFIDEQRAEEILSYQ